MTARPVRRISDLLASGRTLSFEFFPPKTEDGVRALHGVLDELAAYEPAFVSVTYGAGGTTTDRTRGIVLDVNAQRPFPAMPHLTCMSHSKAEVVELLQDYLAHGVHNVLALAGDPPLDGSPSAGEFHYALELVQLVREQGDFSVGVAAFPEGHPRSVDAASDRRHLAAKLEAADFAITQFFYDVDDYVRLVDELDALGVRKPVIPGVMPPTNPASVRRFAAINGSRVPEAALDRIAAAEPDEQLRLAVDLASELSRQLLEAGAPGLHLYALNRAEAPARIVENVRDLL
jgi:methylenetetrahydrofolate reductase (NADPH)